MPINIGLFGFGRTGSVVAKVIASDPAFSLKWVCRKTIPSNLTYASHALGFDESFSPFVTFDNLNPLAMFSSLQLRRGVTPCLYRRMLATESRPLLRRGLVRHCSPDDDTRLSF